MACIGQVWAAASQGQGMRCSIFIASQNKRLANIFWLTFYFVILSRVVMNFVDRVQKSLLSAVFLDIKNP